MRRAPGGGRRGSGSGGLPEAEPEPERAHGGSAINAELRNEMKAADAATPPPPADRSGPERKGAKKRRELRPLDFDSLSFKVADLGNACWTRTTAPRTSRRGSTGAPK